MDFSNKVKFYITEMEAEIVNGRIPTNKIYSNGNIITANGITKQNLLDIGNLMKSHNILQYFNSDNLDSYDIKHDTPNTYLLTSDDGKRKWKWQIGSSKLIPV